MNPVVLQAQGLGKCYQIYESPRDRLKALLGWSSNAKVHWALQGVDFALVRGQCLGVIGDNGAGKSTLLKLLAGTLQPSHGVLSRVGRLTAILELGAGFHPDFTGRQNVLFGAGLAGLSQQEITLLLTEIIQFSELGDAIDRPVKTYSSGMAVRLAFALVTAVQPEVLIIDEALAVGDQHFQKKCVERILAFRQNGCTVLFCSHSLYHVRQLCDQVLWLNQGQVMGLGATEGVLAAYDAHVRMQDRVGVESQEPRPAKNISTTSVATLSAARVIGRNESGLVAGPDLIVEVKATTQESQSAPSIGVMLEQYKGVGITSVATHAEGCAPQLIESVDGFNTWQVTLVFTELPLHSGEYSLSFYLFDSAGMVVYDEWKDYIQFHWITKSMTPGLVRLPHQWK